MAGPWSKNEFEFASQIEVTYPVSPGALVGGDFYRADAVFPFGRVVARLDRDKDSGTSASVLGTQKGREHGTWKQSGNIIPSGNAATPTAPDMDDLFKAHYGEKFTCTAHTTTAAGSAGVTLNLTAGGGAASGIRTGGGDLIMVDVDATNGMEVRQVVSRATDVVTVDRAFTANPAAARNVYVGTTYRFLASSIISLHLWQYLNVDNFRHKMGGCGVFDLGIDIDASSQTPVATISLSGEGEKIATHTTARPTPVYATTDPLIPTQGKVFIGASGKLCVVKAGIKSNNALELGQNESCSLFPTRLKRTANGGRYKVEQDLDMILMSGIVEGYFDNASGLTAYDTIVQLGITPGQTVAWRTPKWILDGDLGEQDLEVAVMMKGRCYAATVVDTEMSLAFL